MRKKYINNLEELNREFDFEFLIQSIIENRLTCRDVEKLYGIEQRFLSKINKEMNLGIKKSWSQQRNTYNKYKIFKDDLEDLYLNEELSVRAIANIYNCSTGCIKGALIYFGILEDLNNLRPANYSKYYDSRRVQYHNHRVYRTVMAKHLGRPLTDLEVVHHIDFDRSHNTIDNLFLFESQRVHDLYHGYIRSHEYIHPQEFIDSIYPKYLETFLDKDWLYNEYIISNESMASISEYCDISRGSIKTSLLEFNILNSKPKRINQYDK